MKSLGFGSKCECAEIRFLKDEKLNAACVSGETVLEHGQNRQIIQF